MGRLSRTCSAHHRSSKNFSPSLLVTFFWCLRLFWAACPSFNGSKWPFSTLSYKMSSLPQGPGMSADAYARILKYLVSSSPVLRVQQGEDERQPFHCDYFSPSHRSPEDGWEPVYQMSAQRAGLFRGSRYSTGQMFLGKVLFPRRSKITLDKR